MASTKTAEKKGKKGRKPVDPNETPSGKFRRIAASRTQAVLNNLRLLRNCSNSGYAYTPEEVEHIFQAIQDATAEAYQAFQNGGKSVRKPFSF